MTEPQFVWDPNKARENERKHGVGFQEASTAFRDEEGLRIYDPDHSEKEDRYLLLAMSDRGRLLVISHCYRANDTQIRIISAWKAEKDEIQQYIRRKS
jgi:uncharacterized DUF497 family protein